MPSSLKKGCNSRMVSGKVDPSSILDKKVLGSTKVSTSYNHFQTTSSGTVLVPSGRPDFFHLNFLNTCYFEFLYVSVLFGDLKVFLSIFELLYCLLRHFPEVFQVCPRRIDTLWTCLDESDRILNKSRINTIKRALLSLEELRQYLF